VDCPCQADGATLTDLVLSSSGQSRQELQAGPGGGSPPRASSFSAAGVKAGRQMSKTFRAVLPSGGSHEVDLLRCLFDILPAGVGQTDVGRAQSPSESR